MIYACIRMLQEWASPLTVVNYTLPGGASGFVAATRVSRRKVQGSLNGSFNTGEYFRGVSPRKYKNVERAFAMLAFPLPLALLSAGLVYDLAGFFPAALLVQYTGLVMKRWFFFTQAIHAQNLYYQSV